MSELIKIFKVVAIVGIIVAGLTLLGSTINALVPWEYLKYFFIIFRKTILPFDFMVDTDAIIAVFSTSLLILIAVWAYKGSVPLIKRFFLK